MSPQPKQQEQDKPAATPERKAPAKGEHNDAVNDLLSYAQGLRDEKDDLFARIEANRVTLRNYKTMGLLSDKQAEAIDKFYPKPKRGEAKASDGQPAAAAA